MLNVYHVVNTRRDSDNTWWTPSRTRWENPFDK